MRARAMLGGAAALLTLAVTACARALDTRESALAIVGVHVVDAEHDSTRHDMTLVVRGARIESIAPRATARIPADARVIEARGAWVVPGLWDMHVHTITADWDSVYAPLLLAHGVTGVRDMGDDPRRQQAAARAAASGATLAPRIVTSVRIDGDVRTRASYSRVVRSAAHAAPLLDSLRAEGASLLKIYSSVPRAAYFALAREARARGLPFAGHVPTDVTLADAAEAGQRSIEHSDDLAFACTADERGAKQALAAASRAASGVPPGLARDTMFAVMRRTARSLRASLDRTRCDATLAAMIAHRTWLVPTLVVYQPYARAMGPSVTGDSGLRWIPEAQLAAWRARTAGFAAADTLTVQAFYDLPRVAAARARGVALMTGTDTPLPYIVPGASVHDELALLVAAGLSPRDALAAATLEPARYLAADSLGRVRAGAVADLVLLDGDPLADIRNTRRVRAVVSAGRFLPRARLDSMLAAVARRVRVSSRNR